MGLVIVGLAKNPMIKGIDSLGVALWWEGLTNSFRGNMILRSTFCSFNKSVIFQNVGNG